jgi:cytochrome c oxidase subunit 2
MNRRAGRCLAFGVLFAFAACASRGREVFVREGCGNCHRFRDLGIAGAVDLSNVGSRRDAAWIGKQITDPASHNPATRMPAFPNIGGLDLRSLVAFLQG